jgi:hypothetical protein
MEIMKNKLIITTALMLVASGFVAASPSNDSFFGDDPFFSDDSDEDFFEDDDSFGEDMFDDDFFSDDEDSSENESEGDVGICVIGVDSPCNSEEYDGDNETDENEDDTVTEERHVTPAPEPSYVGEDYLSYPNPRNHFKHDQDIHREGSMKVCTILLNQDGEVITGETVDAEFSVETEGVPYESADNIEFDTPLNQVADLVGTSEELREGDGYLDAECAEYHDLRLNQTYEYGQQEITGEDADEIENVGYQEFWSNQYSPLENVEEYGTSSNSDGEVHLSPGYNTRHAEVIIVNQINR